MIKIAGGIFVKESAGVARLGRLMASRGAADPSVSALANQIGVRSLLRGPGTAVQNAKKVIAMPGALPPGGPNVEQMAAIVARKLEHPVVKSMYERARQRLMLPQAMGGARSMEAALGR